MTPEILITTYLEMTDYSTFKPAYIDNDDVQIVKMDVVDLPFYRFLYQAVGEIWRWRDRAIMPDGDLAHALANAMVYVLYFKGCPAGYIELGTMDETKSIEVAYFGLRQTYFGKGLGKHLLSWGIEQAWQADAKRIWVHTCNLDGPAALPNYKKRGFTVYDETREPMPEIYRSNTLD